MAELGFVLHKHRFAFSPAIIIFISTIIIIVTIFFAVFATVTRPSSSVCEDARAPRLALPSPRCGRVGATARLSTAPPTLLPFTSHSHFHLLCCGCVTLFPPFRTAREASVLLAAVTTIHPFSAKVGHPVRDRFFLANGTSTVRVDRGGGGGGGFHWLRTCTHDGWMFSRDEKQNGGEKLGDTTGTDWVAILRLKV